MQILTGGAALTTTRKAQSPNLASPNSAKVEAANSQPQALADQVEIGYDAVALKAEQNQLVGHAKLGAIFGGATGVLAGAVAGAAGGTLGAITGMTAAPAAALIGAVGLGAAGFMLATHKRQGGLALVGGVLAAGVGAVAGAYGGFYGGAALGALAGSAGGLAGGIAGAVGLGTLGAGFGAAAKVGSELVAHKEQYPNVIARLRAEEAEQGRA